MPRRPRERISSTKTNVFDRDPANPKSSLFWKMALFCSGNIKHFDQNITFRTKQNTKGIQPGPARHGPAQPSRSSDPENRARSLSRGGSGRVWEGSGKDLARIWTDLGGIGRFQAPPAPPPAPPAPPNPSRTSSPKDFSPVRCLTSCSGIDSGRHQAERTNTTKCQ